MSTLLARYYESLRLIAKWLLLHDFEYQVAINIRQHESIRFRYKGVEFEVNATANPQMVARAVLEPVVLRRDVTDFMAMPPLTKIEYEYVEGPIVFGVWKVVDQTEMFTSEDPLSVVEYILFTLTQ